MATAISAALRSAISVLSSINVRGTSAVWSARLAIIATRTSCVSASHPLRVKLIANPCPTVKFVKKVLA